MNYKHIAVITTVFLLLSQSMATAQLQIQHVHTNSLNITTITGSYCSLIENDDYYNIRLGSPSHARITLALGKDIDSAISTLKSLIEFSENAEKDCQIVVEDALGHNIEISSKYNTFFKRRYLLLNMCDNPTIKRDISHKELFKALCYMQQMKRTKEYMQTLKTKVSQ